MAEIAFELQVVKGNKPGFENVEYDFLGRVSERLQIGEKVMPIWMRRNAAPGQRPPVLA